MNRANNARTRWIRESCADIGAAATRRGVKPILVCERGSGPLVIRPATELRGLGAAARRCGVSHTHLRKVLQGERKPSAELAAKMKKLGLKPGQMKEG